MSALFRTYTPFPFQIRSGRGDRILAEDGREFFDFYGGHCVASTGHSHPRVVQAIAEQASQLLFYSTAGSLPIRERAAEALIEFAKGSGLSQVFFCNSGAEANENAIKIAHRLTGRKVVMGAVGGWHGRTLGCLSVTDDAKLTEPMQDWLLPHRRLPLNDLVALDQIDFSDVACVIVEPVQSLSGIVACDGQWLRALATKLKAAGSLLILDEIQTGVGRLGVPFACHHYGVTPDLLCSAKGLASGVPIGAVLMRPEHAQALSPADLGSTFGAGPLACAALLATLNVIASEQLMANALKQESLLRQGLLGSAVKAVRGRGLLLGLETDTAAALKEHLFRDRILVGSSGDPKVLRLMPPLDLSDEAVAALLASVHRFTP